MLHEKELIEALKLNNQRFMDEMPGECKTHEFSERFERRMNHYIKAHKTYNGNIWLERFVRYSSGVAAVVLCCIVINFVSVKAFDINLWHIIAGYESGYTQLSFERNGNETVDADMPVNTENSVTQRYCIGKVPEGYRDVTENSPDEEWTNQVFVTEGGDSIVYLEGPVSEELLVDIESGEKKIQTVAGKKVYYEIKEDSIVAYFVDVKYYHMLTIEGKDANPETANKIISALEKIHENEK